MTQKVQPNDIFIFNRNVVIVTDNKQKIVTGFKLRATIKKDKFEQWREKDRLKMVAKFGDSIEIDYSYTIGKDKHISVH